jgi:hypothetical protein
MTLTQGGSVSTNINNVPGYAGRRRREAQYGFSGQQNYFGGSTATNFGFGKRKRDAQFNQV